LRVDALRLTLLELPARWGDVAGQLARVERALAAQPPGDLVLLPEASLTGYLSPQLGCDPARFAEPLTGRTAQALAGLAARFRCAVVGPLIEREGRQLFNAMIGFDREGRRFLHYRKRHPWYPEVWATPSAQPYPTAHLGGLTIACAICFDAQFLLDEEPEALEDADVLLFPSAWVEEDDSRASLLPDLARRFDVAIANANWGIGEPRIPGQGGSMIVARDGAVVARVEEGTARVDAAIGPKQPAAS
jgi:predicted amidohydrolase